MANFEKAVAKLLELEGGRVDDPSDPGGRTNFGITQTNWNAYLSSHEVDAPLPQDVWDLDADHATAYYFSEWWQKGGFERVASDEVATMYFVTAVNTGLVTATKLLQIWTGFPLNIDGVLGPDTLRAVNYGSALALDYVSVLKAYYVGLHNKRFEAGWLKRANSLLA